MAGHSRPKDSVAGRDEPGHDERANYFPAVRPLIPRRPIYLLCFFLSLRRFFFFFLRSLSSSSSSPSEHLAVIVFSQRLVNAGFVFGGLGGLAASRRRL